MPYLRSAQFKDNQRLQNAANGGKLIAKGETSHGVAAIQAALQDIGYQLPNSTKPNKSMDGIFGAETEGAIKKFQGSQTLKADGIVGPKTLAALDELLLKNAKPTPPRPPKRRPTRPKLPPAPPKPPVVPAPARPPSAPTPPQPPAAPTQPVQVDDPYYKIGTDDPPLGHDVGAGAWNSKSWEFSTVAKKVAIEELLGTPTNIYPGPNATKHMKHYFANHGRSLTIDLEDMISSVPRAQTALVDEFRQAQRFIQKLPPGTHNFTSKSGETAYNRKEANADWFFAIGGYTYWGKGIANITMVGAQKQYSVTFFFKFYDRYNWDGNKSVTIGGITVTDEFMGEFHRQGLAREYDCFGSVRRPVAWTGDVAVPPDEKIISPPGR